MTNERAAFIMLTTNQKPAAAPDVPNIECTPVRYTCTKCSRACTRSCTVQILGKMTKSIPNAKVACAKVMLKVVHSKTLV